MDDPRRARLTLLGERVELLPEGCAHWPSRRTLIVADWNGQREERARLARAVLDTGAERVLVVGRGLPEPLPGLAAELVAADGLEEAGFVFRSRPAAYPGRFVWCGFLSPRAGGRPAFYLRPETGVLPSFGDEDGTEIRPSPGESVYAIEDGFVVRSLPSLNDGMLE